MVPLSPLQKVSVSPLCRVLSLITSAKDIFFLPRKVNSQGSSGWEGHRHLASEAAVLAFMKESVEIHGAGNLSHSSLKLS